jgi:protein-disulfide isomerase
MRLGLTIVLAAVGLVAGPVAHGVAKQDDPHATRTKGSPTAPVTVYEMSDFQCPFCAEFALQTMPALDREYVQTGKVRFVWVNLPLSYHKNAVPAAELAMCGARQGRFWQLHDLLFRNQQRWAGLGEPGSYFLSLGDSAGANRDSISTCLRDGAVRALVRADAEGAVRSGARSTPTFYIEGGLLVGAQPIEVFRAVLDSIVRVKTQGPR